MINFEILQVLIQGEPRGIDASKKVSQQIWELEVFSCHVEGVDFSQFYDNLRLFLKLALNLVILAPIFENL